MTQQIINLGSGPDTQTGDSLYTAFTKVNSNFTELYSVFDGNGISNINANVIISNDIVVTSNIRSGNIAAYGNIEAVGYVITAGAFYPNGVPIGGLQAIGSNLLPLTSNLYTVGSQIFQFSEGYFSTNITLSGANVTVRNGMLYVDGQIASGNYGNANVAQYLPVYGGNVNATIITANQSFITQTGTLSNLTANTARIYGNLVVEGNLSVDGNVTFFNVDNLLVEDPIITLNTGANGAPLSFDNGFDSGIKTYYFDTANRESFFGRKDSTGYFEYYSNVVTEVGNIVSGTYGTIKTGNLLLTETANITGNITANYFLGNGRFLDGIDTTLISNGNSNVQVYQNGNISISSGGVANVAQFTTIGGNIVGDFYITGTIKALNYIGNVQGNLSAPGANTQVIFNDNSTAAATSGFTFDKSTNSVVITGDLTSLGQAYLSNLTILGNTVYVTNTGDDIVLQPDGIANVYIGEIGQNNQLVVSGNIVTPKNVIVNNAIVIDSNGNIVTARLQDSGVTAGTYGNSSAVPVITVDEKGRITVANTTAVAGVNNVTYDPVTSNLTVFTSAGTNFSVDIGVGTDDSPVFANLSVYGNSTTQALTVNSNATIGATLSAAGGIQNTAIGNEITSSGAFTAITANIIGNTGTSFFGNIFTAYESFNGTLNGVLGQAGGNAATISELSVTGNATVQLLLSNSDVHVNSTVISQSIVTETINANNAVTVNSLTANTDSQFLATVQVTGNISAANVNSTGNLRISGVVVAGRGVQSTPIGNIVAAPGHFTTLESNANTTVQALTVNNDATIGTTLSVSGNTIVANLRTDGTILITNTINSTGANTGALIVQGGASFEKDVHVLGNIYATNIVAINANTISVTDPLLYLSANTPYPYNYDIGFFSQFQTGVSSGYQHTGFVRDVDDGVWKLFSNVVAEPTITVDLTDAVFDQLLTGTHVVLGQIIGNSTLSVYGNAVVGNLIANANISAQNLNVAGLEVVGNIAVGALTVINSAVISGTLSAPGGLQNTPIGNAIPSTAQFTTVSTSGNITTAALTVNGSSTIGSTLSVIGNILSGNVITGTIFTSNILASTIRLLADTVILANSNVIPAANSVYTLGNSTHVWSQIFANNVFANGNITTNGVTVTGSGTFATTLSAQSGIQNTAIGNVIPSTGNFTSIDVSSNAVVNGLTVNNSVTIGSTLSVTANLTAPYFIGNIIGNITGNLAAPGSNRQVMFNDRGIIGGDTGLIYNTDINELTLDGNLDVDWIYATGGAEFKLPVVVDAGIQNTVIGNVTPSSAQFTTINSSANTTVNGLTVNSSATFGTSISVAGGIQNTPIGNVTRNSAQFTTVDASGNVTVNEITVNSSATIGGTLDVDGAMLVAAIDVAGHANVGNLQISGNLTGNLIPTANAIYSIGSPSRRFKDLYLSGNTLYLGDVTLSSDENNFVIAGNIISANVFAPIIGNAGTDFVGETLSISGNATAAAITVNGSVTTGSTISAAGGIQATAIGNSTPSTAQFTTLNTSGNSTVSALTVNNSVTIGTNLSTGGQAIIFGGLQSTPIGNSQPSSAIFTTQSVSGNSTVNALTVNTSVVVGSSLQTIGGLQASPIGNAVASSGQFTTLSATGNVTGAAITANGSLTVGATLSASAGIQATVIGNVTPAAAQFTSLTTNGNLTTANITVNSAAVIGSTLRANGGIQDTVIGNVTPSSAQFTTLSTSGTATVNALISNTSAQSSTLSVSGNATVNQLTINSTATVGGTLGVTANIIGSGLSLSGSQTTAGSLSAAGGIQATPIGNASPSTAVFTTIAGDSLTITGNTVLGNLDVLGNITYINSVITTLKDPIIELNTGTNGAPLSGSAPYDSGLKTHYWDGANDRSAFFGRSNSSGYFEYYSNVTNEIANVISGTLGTIRTGNLVLTNTATIADTLVVGSNVTINALTVNTSAVVVQTLQAQGGLQNTVIGNITPTTAYFTEISTSGNTTTSNLIVNVGLISNGNVSAPYFIGNIVGNITGNISAAGANTQVLFNDNSLVGASSQLTFNKTSNVLTVGGNLNSNGITITGTGTVSSTLSASGGLQNTVIGNVTPSTALFTTVVTSGNITVSALSVNNTVTIGSTLGVTANINGSGITLSGDQTLAGRLNAAGGIQNTAIGNVISNTGKFTTLETTGTATVNQLTSNGSVTGAAAQFTTINGSANSTVNALTVNSSAVIGTSLQAQGGIQNTVIGNVTPSSAQFTTLTASGNITVANLSVNNSVTVGSTAEITGILTVTNSTASTSNVTGAVQVTGGVGIGGNLYVGNRVGWVAANSVSAVYQIYNSSTNSLDTVFG